MPTKTLILTSLAPGTDELTVTLSEGKNYTGAEAKLGVEVSVLPKADPVFKNNSWETIAAICAAGKASETWSVGDTKMFSIGYEIYHAQIIGFDHDDLDTTDSKYGTDYNGGTNKAAMTLLMEEIFSNTYRIHSSNINSVSWEKCEFRTSTLPTLIPQIDSGLRAVVRNITKKTAQSTSSSTILNTDDNFFFASEIEVYGNNTRTWPGEGTQYDYFKTASKIKKKGGTNYYWWLRSPNKSYSDEFLVADTNGRSGSIRAAFNGVGVALCCCI